MKNKKWDRADIFLAKIAFDRAHNGRTDFDELILMVGEELATYGFDIPGITDWNGNDTEAVLNSQGLSSRAVEWMRIRKGLKKGYEHTGD